MARVIILSKEEQKVFSTPSVLRYTQQGYYLKIPHALKRFVSLLKDDNNKIYFNLLYTYYTVDKVFYDRDTFHIQDIKYLMDKLAMHTYNQYFDLSQRQIRRYKQTIKSYLLINNYTDEMKEILLREATTMASNFTHRKKIFYSLVELSKKLKIEVPSYTELSQIITLAVNYQKKSIIDKLALCMADSLNSLVCFICSSLILYFNWESLTSPV